MNTSEQGGKLSEQKISCDEITGLNSDLDGDLDGKLSLRGKQVKDFLSEHGVKERSMAGLVAEVIDVNVHTARRKIKGETDFSDKELTALFDWAGYEYLGIYGLRKKTSDAQEDAGDKLIYGEDYVESLVSIAGESKNCRIWLKKGKVAPAAKGFFVVETASGEYKVVSERNVQIGTEPSLIERVEFIEPWVYEGSGPYLCIYHENEGEEVETVAESFRKAGFKTKGISDRETLRSSLKLEKFEAFLIEWMSWEGWNGIDVAQEIRYAFPSVPIILLVGIDEGGEEEVVEAGKRLNATILEQPAKTNKITGSILDQLRITKSKR